MAHKVICDKCNGAGKILHFRENGSWWDCCNVCNGKGVLSHNDFDVDDIDMVVITRQEYEELLEYKHMYEDLCT